MLTVIVMLSMVWALTLQTIQNRLSWPVLFRDGVLSEFFLMNILCNGDILANDHSSCTAHADNLANVGGLDITWQCHEHTNALLEAFTSKEVQDDYGIVGDILVSLLTSISTEGYLI